MNRARGEVEIQIDGNPHALCLTLGGLAELEAEFACESLADLQSKLSNLSAHGMRRVLEILLVDREAGIELSHVSPGAAARAIGDAFHAALG
ncbi:MAG: GTA-gp10 family protein [Henriciella sp.]